MGSEISVWVSARLPLEIRACGMLLAVIGTSVERRLVVEVVKLLEAKLTTEETALYLGDIDLNLRRGILLPRNDENLYDPY